MALFKALGEVIDLPKDAVWLRITFAVDRPVMVTCKSLARVGDEFKSEFRKYHLVEKIDG